LCRQDDGGSLLNNDALIMAVVLLFDGVVDDYGGDSDSGDSLLSVKEGEFFIIIVDVFCYYL